MYVHATRAAALVGALAMTACPAADSSDPLGGSSSAAGDDGSGAPGSAGPSGSGDPSDSGNPGESGTPGESGGTPDGCGDIVGEGFAQGQIAQDWALMDGSGNEVHLHDYCGKVIFLEIGSEW